MSGLDTKICPGCGNDWHSLDDNDEETNTCAECGFEAENVPTVREMLTETQHADWCDLAAFARGLAGIVLENVAEVRRLLDGGKS